MRANGRAWNERKSVAVLRSQFTWEMRNAPRWTRTARRKQNHHSIGLMVRLRMGRKRRNSVQLQRKRSRVRVAKNMVSASPLRIGYSHFFFFFLLSRAYIIICVIFINKKIVSENSQRRQKQKNSFCEWHLSMTCSICLSSRFVVHTTEPTNRKKNTLWIFCGGVDDE